MRYDGWGVGLIKTNPSIAIEHNSNRKRDSSTAGEPFLAYQERLNKSREENKCQAEENKHQTEEIKHLKAALRELVS